MGSREKSGQASMVAILQGSQAAAWRLPYEQLAAAACCGTCTAQLSLARCQRLVSTLNASQVTALKLHPVFLTKPNHWCFPLMCWV